MSSPRDQNIHIHLPSDRTQRLGIAQRHYLMTVKHTYPQGTVLQHERWRKSGVL